MSFDLKKYLSFGNRPSGDAAVSRVTSEGVLEFKRPFKSWPKELQKLWRQDLYFLWPGLFVRRLPETNQQVALCVQVDNCPLKAPGTESRDCLRYAGGICQTASKQAGGQPLSLKTLSRFLGISRESLSRYRENAIKSLLLEIVSDVELCDYLESMGYNTQKELHETC